MGSRIDHLLFLTGGVILPRLSQLASRALPAAGTDLALERRLEDLERQLAQGDLVPQGFCELAADAARAPGMAGALAQAMLARAEILPGMAALLEELAPRARLGLVSDYPQQWLESIVDGSGLARFFSPATIAYTAAWRRTDLYSALTAEGLIQPGRTLWVDYDSPRAAIGIRRGIDVALCVDARRFRRDLGLWGLLPMTSA